MASNKKVEKSGFTYSKLAESVGIHKAYLSQAMKKKVILNTDQAFAIADFFQLNEDQSDFFLLLVEYARTGNYKRKRSIKLKIEQMKTKYLKTENNLEFKSVIQGEDLADYYTNPIYQIVHLSLSLEKFRNKPELLKEYFHLDENFYSKIINYLIEKRLIEIHDSQIIKKQTDVHLSKDNPLYNTWKDKLRLMAIGNTFINPDRNNYQYSALITTSPESRELIIGNFQEFLEKSKKLVAKNQATELLQLNFDFFKILS